MPSFGNGGFDATKVEPKKKFEPLPAGKYRATIVKSEFKQTKNGNGRYLELTIEVIDGEFKGRRVFSRLNLDNPNQQAVAIAQAELSAICHAVSVMNPQQSEQLHNIPFVVGVKVKERSDKQGEYTNEVAGYESTESVSQSQPPTDVGSAPWSQPVASTPSSDDVPF